MKIAFIGTYPPRQCGIGTYTRNKFVAMTGRVPGKDSHEGIVVAVNDQDAEYDYPPEVKFVIRQQQQPDYIAAANFLNNSGVDICVLEHEFGIFGGDNGVFLLSLLHELKIPVIAVLHTVLKDPSAGEKFVTTEIVAMASRTVVMSRKAVSFLTEHYAVDPAKLEILLHGVPDLKFDTRMSKKEFRLEDKKVILTFGLISRNKGIETVLKALPPIVAKYPDVVYIVLGKTHPVVMRHCGEEYRNSLGKLVSELKLSDHVVFVNEFVNERKLCKYLAAADIYVTPYLNEAQITSGTLAYAVGAGCAVISTPYWHACELLGEGRGRLFNFNDNVQLSSILMELLDRPAVLNTLRERAQAFGRETTWSRIGDKYLSLSRRILKEQLPKEERGIETVVLPEFSLDHIRRMTDHTGIIQHAKYSVPNWKEGYCLDDNARALLMISMACRQERNPVAMELLPVYLSYIHYTQNEDGTFRNFVNFSRNFLDTCGSEDSFGRAIWALGYLVAHSPGDGYCQTAKEIFSRAAPNFKNLKYPRAIANTLIGISYYLQRVPSDNDLMQTGMDLAAVLVRLYRENKDADWHWFEPILTYDNALLPLSLFHAASITNDREVLSVALETARFLTGVTMRNGYLSVVGNEKWYRKDGECSLFAQQPIDAMAMVLMFQKAYQLTNDRAHLENLYTAFRWFHGENDLRVTLYDEETKGCCDGLEYYGVNRNQGAESTLAYLISHLAVQQALSGMVNVDGQMQKTRDITATGTAKVIAV